jgi:L-ascorbate metabolism protein UlaG (beta-lactamase superfamily)
MSSDIRRRTLLTGAASASLGVLAAQGQAQATQSSAALPPTPSRRFAAFRWLGTSGWHVRTPTTTLLVDPYLSRFDTGLAAGRFSVTTPLRVDPDAIDAALGAPGGEDGDVDAVLVTHTHWDHFGDVPHIATTRGAMVYTTLTGYHLAQAMGVAISQLAPVKGGEEMHVGDLVVRVVRSLHSRSASGGLLLPGVVTAPPEAPRTVADLPEGDTLAFLLRSPHGRSALLMGASDYDDQALQGLRPDVVALPVPSTDVTADYVGRLMSALDEPRVVIPVHWDDFESPLTNPPRTSENNRERLRTMTAQIRRHAPRTRIIVPRYGEPLWLF